MSAIECVLWICQIDSQCYLDNFNGHSCNVHTVALVTRMTRHICLYWVARGRRRFRPLVDRRHYWGLGLTCQSWDIKVSHLNLTPLLHDW